MARKTKKIKAFGRFGTGYGIRIRKSLNKLEAVQRTSQPSPFIEGGKAKRLSVGIWKCIKTGKVFAGPAYTLKKE